MADSILGNSYSFRISDYHVIFDVEEKDIAVLRVGHRKKI
jgi:mRNA-degrading endonuclease RelE of RelBE toxin-antitoxin system